MSFEEIIDGMYSNLGGKIKKFARGWFVLMSALSVIAGVIFPFVALVEGWDVDGLLPFMISLILSPIAVVICIAVFYVSSWPIYWAGELLERVCKIEESQCGVVMEEKPKAQDTASVKRQINGNVEEEPNSIKNIRSYQFRGSEDLDNYIIPDGVTRIGQGAFSHCKNLRCVSIPSSVTDIDMYAFMKCESLEKIIFRGTQEQWTAIRKAAWWDHLTGAYTVDFE